MGFRSVQSGRLNKYCLTTEAHVYEQLDQDCTRKRGEFNLSLLVRQGSYSSISFS